ncbi:hypothetical protein [Nocardioides sp. W7]|uniref:hypothetical protein n=1 Tax=Nocardioides sp. W7 TaxID=2931390 RepID=UPI001FD4B334|nr:hypothetical protein [Nocardioides sp. W7]
MCSLLIRLILATIWAACLTMVLRTEAYADPTCAHVNPATGVCVVYVEAPPAPSNPATPEDNGPEDSGSGAACYWDPSKQGVGGPSAGPVPCTSEYGFWSNAYNCYLKLADPQPPAGDPNWQGHEPGDGAVYTCFQPQTSMLVYIWSLDTPEGSGAGPSPRDVAELAVKQMNLSAINIGIAPKPGPDSVGLVGMPVWMWVQSPDEHTFGPITATASAGGMTITATARVLRVTWDMGDGTEVVCERAGTPYLPSYGRKDSPDCGHVYERSSAREPDEAYTVTATSSWVITWSGAGQTGTIRLNGLNRSTQIQIGEAQVLVN